MCVQVMKLEMFDAVMDGDIEAFLKSYLMMMGQKEENPNEL